jgi:hypothetical protein
MDLDEQVKDLHRDLKRKYQRHGSQIEEIWRSFGQKERVKVIRDGAADDEVLKNRSDTSISGCRGWSTGKVINSCTSQEGRALRPD